MADNTLKQIMHLIASADQAELRQAAIRVAGAVGPAKDRGLVKTLLPVLDEADPALRHSAIEALGQLRAEEALPPLVALVRQGGPDVEPAVRAAGRLGTRGARAVGKVMAESSPVLRRRIAAALAEGGTESAAVASAHALLDEDAGVVDAAARSLAGQVASFSAGQRRALAEDLIHSLQPKNRKTLSAPSEAAMIRVLGVLHDSRAEPVYWDSLDPDRPAAIRAAALHALGTLPLPSGDANWAAVQKLLACAAGADFQIVAPALLLLKNVPVSRKNTRHWLHLLQAHDVAARRFAVDKLRDVATAEVASALAAQLRHPDRALRDDAVAALRGSPPGRQALLELLLEAPNVEEAWSLARVLASSRSAEREEPGAPREALKKRAPLFAQACRYQDQDDRRAEPLWFLLREMDHDWVRDQIAERALALRKKKDYAGTLAYLRLLTRDPACGEEIRFESAATGLKESGHDTSASTRHSDPALNQFARLLQNPAFDVIGRISKAKWLDADDLFYLGFHFAEQTHQAREFGRQVLELLIKRTPRSDLAKNARRKLKSEGLT
jgi:HEAT repeat protein